MWVETLRPAPVLNTPDFSFAFGGKSGSEIPLNAKGHPYFYEWVALPGTPLKVEEVLPNGIYRISASFYPASSLYIDSRFVRETAKFAYPQMPSKETILKKMESLIGTQYVWGGNWSNGIPEMISYYPPKESIDEKTKNYWTMKGVDCSGLLYETSIGTTPRNTSQLIHFGHSLSLPDFRNEALASFLSPLDMIIYPGHVVFVLDSHTTIESKYPYGVIQRKLKVRLDEIASERTLVSEWNPSLDPGKYFMIRRFLT